MQRSSGEGAGARGGAFFACTFCFFCPFPTPFLAGAAADFLEAPGFFFTPVPVLPTDPLAVVVVAGVVTELVVGAPVLLGLSGAVGLGGGARARARFSWV